jgi:hypothetical protein
VARPLDDQASWKDDWQGSGSRENGSPLHPERVSKLFAEAVRKAIEQPPKPTLLDRCRGSGCTTYDARTPTLGLAAGIPVGVISQRLGHKSTCITQDKDIYQHAPRELQEDAAMQIADLVNLGGKPRSAATDSDAR